ncbi:MAG: CRISPR-associated endonuclease Cas3'', partial [Geobacteraceae bacterium]|nr:CRISPR-associated endonuclease Cas3'' [Geobacteraceae bacterium]
MEYLAHSMNNHGRSHLAREHLTAVAKLSMHFAGNSKWKEEAFFAGILHDLGKYADLFQARLRGEASGLDHWSAGAWV